MEVHVACVNQDFKCTKLTQDRKWRCDLMALKGKSLCEEHSRGNKSGIRRNRCDEEKEVVLGGCGSGVPVVRGGIKQRGMPKGSKNVEEKSVLKENVGGVKIEWSVGRRRGSNNKEKINFFDGSASGARSVHGVVKKRVRQEDLKNEKNRVFEKNGGGDESGERGIRWSKVNDEIGMLVGGELGREAVPKKQYVDIASLFIAMRKKEEHGSGRGLLLGVGKKRGWPRGSKSSSKKLVLEENNGKVGRGKDIGRQDGLKNEDMYDVSGEDTCANDTAQEVGPNTTVRPSRLKSTPAWAKDFIN